METNLQGQIDTESESSFGTESETDNVRSYLHAEAIVSASSIQRLIQTSDDIESSFKSLSML